MKSLLLTAAVLMGVNAAATTLSCMDTKTFNYGRAKLINDGSGKVKVQLSSSTLGLKLSDIVPLDVSYVTAAIEFPAGDCTATGCIGSYPKMTVTANGEKPVEIFLDKAAIEFQAAMVDYELIGQNTKLVHAGIMVNKCVTIP